MNIQFRAPLEPGANQKLCSDSNLQSVAKEPFNVSVIIPTHNRRSTLLRAIQSILEQEIPVFEILVVDDASSDGTRDIDFAAIDPRIQLISLPENRGGAVARNIGIEKASGNWIAFLDSDDVWFPHTLKQQKNVVDGQDITSQDFFVCGNVVCRRGDGSEYIYNARPPRSDESLSEYFLVHGFSFPIHSLLIPASALKKIRFDEKLKRHQDWDLVLRLVAAGFRYVYSHAAAGIYMLGNDNRVSRSKGADATLYWFEKDRELLLSPACAYYYTRHYFTKHVRDKPMEALRAVSRLALVDAKSFLFTVRAFAWLVFQRMGLIGRT